MAVRWSLAHPLPATGVPVFLAERGIDVYRVYSRLHRRRHGPPEPVPLREDAPLRE